jgi:hypothetical protein
MSRPSSRRSFSRSSGAGRGLAAEGADPHAPVGFVADGIQEFDAAEALQEQVRGAVFALLAGAHDADRGHPVRGLEGIGHVQTLEIETGDGEQSVRGEDFAQHLPVTRLKDMQGQQCLRKEGQIGQGHYRHFVRQCDLHFHSRTVGGSCRNTTPPVKWDSTWRNYQLLCHKV